VCNNMLIEVDKAHIGPAVKTLSRAFQGYPLIQYSYPDAALREHVSHYFFVAAVRYGIRYGVVHATSPEFEGVAVWMPPGGFPMTFGRVLRSVPLSVMAGFLLAGGGRMYNVSNYLDTMHKRLTPFRHWYLEAIGVSPESRGKGFAAVLVRSMLAIIDEEGLPCYLETMDEKNVGIYERFGFKVIEESQVPGTPLFTWAMLRESK
jgi:ribosomal protein S18 acetylase RimI-like enzyme